MKKTSRDAILLVLFASVLTVSQDGCVPAHAEEDKPELVFRPDQSRAGEVELPRLPEESPKEKAPPVPLEEVRGDFTACTAARLLHLELARRISDLDPSRATGKKWTEYSSSRALLGRWGEHIAQDEVCSSETDPGLAEGIMKLYRTVVDYQDMRRRAAIRAPLTLSTASEAGRLLDRVKDIPHSRQPGPILAPQKNAASAFPLETEFARRAQLLTEALKRLTQVDPTGGRERQ